MSISRDPRNWLWVKEPVALLPGTFGIYMKKDTAAELNKLSHNNPFPQVKFCDELYNRDFVIGFLPIDTISPKMDEWYRTLGLKTSSTQNQ